MKKDRIALAIIGLIVIGIIFAIPSLNFLNTFHSVNGYDGFFSYFILKDSLTYSIMGSIIFAILLILSLIFYFKILKKSNELDLKKIMLLILTIGSVFLISLPNTSSDVFYYMGTGRILEEYGANPYYFSINEVLESNEDLILENAGVWSDAIVVYGPIWMIVCFVLNKISFGSITFLLYCFKFSALIFHILNCYLIYKITKKKKMVLLYGLNPLILLEFLINVHNDIYLIFFVLFAIYFLKEKKNIWMSLLMLALSVGIKYITLILVPIFVLYYLQDKKMIKKILYILIYAVFFIGLIYIMYLPFVNSVTDIFNIVFSQQNKIKDSIYLLIALLTNNETVLSIINSIVIFTLMYYYIITCLKLLLRESTFSDIMKKTSIILFVVIFGVLTNLTSWYLSWFFISMFWIKGKYIKDILWIQFLYELTYSFLYFWHSDDYIYATIIIPVILIGMVARHMYLNAQKSKVNMIEKKN